MSSSLHPALMSTAGVEHHSMVTRGECDLLARELRTDLTSISSHDKKIVQLKKDLRQLKNRAPDTLAAILTDAHNRHQPVAQRMASTIRGFFSTRTRAVRRKLCDLMQPETAEEGQLNDVQMKIAQGDHSRPTLFEFKKEIGDYRAILDEIELAVDAELYPAAQP